MWFSIHPAVRPLSTKDSGGNRTNHNLAPTNPNRATPTNPRHTCSPLRPRRAANRAATSVAIQTPATTLIAYQEILNNTVDPQADAATQSHTRFTDGRARGCKRDQNNRGRNLETKPS